MSEFQPFVMERMMSKYENAVEYNLSESGAHPLSLRTLLEYGGRAVEELLDTSFGYPHANGAPELRERIADLYDGASADNVLVTVGAIEANYLTIRTLLSAGDEIVIMLPNYMQIWGVAKNHGLTIKTFHLHEENGWAPNLDEMNQLVTEKTKLIAICNPNNPTGYILTEHEINAIVRSAEQVGAWILADEVYGGAERLSDKQSPSFYGRYDRVLAINSLSKAYGLPGLRTGWVVGPEDVIDDIWARHEYVAITATMLANKLAALALSPKVRPRIFDRTRRYIRDGYPILQEWMRTHDNTFEVVPPQAAAIAFVRYHLDINSTEFVDRLRKEKSVLIVPGDHFGIDYHVRISFGLPHNYLVPALDRIRELIDELSEG